jgi:uncharacterized membrane protein
MGIGTVIYHLAVSLWVGGAALFTFILTPAIFRGYSRDEAGRIVGVLFPGYFRWGLVCGGVALLSHFASAGSSTLTPPVLISAMLLLTTVQAFVIEPKAAELKKSIPSFEHTPSDNPYRAAFRKLHGISAAANLAVIAGGIALVILF